MTAVTTPSALTRHDCSEMAAALDGLAQSLHAGRPVPRADLGQFDDRAGSTWRAGPEPEPRRHARFEAARDDFAIASDLCAFGAAYEGRVVERSARSMAHQFRHMAEDCLTRDARRVLPLAVSSDIERLAARYARPSGN